ncbi:MAG: hypothetical protein AAF581_00145 [Planctomycetota bacterium]
MAIALATVAPGAGPVVINFDVDASGLPIVAPVNFSSTTALTETYSAWGVHFSGFATGTGGGILNDGSSFGVPAQSGSNFLAFNRQANFSNGHLPTDPQQIHFDMPVSGVTISVAGGQSPATFEMRAYDENDFELASATVTTMVFAPLSVTAGIGIKRVEIIELGTDNTFVFDDLIIDTTAPEFVRGDCSGDGSFSLSDAIVLLGNLFPQTTPPPIDCDDACDGNDDGGLNLVDVIALLNALFGSPTIPLVGPSTCGWDPTVDALHCAAYTPCP